MASFDIVSEVDIQEVDNAVNQARKQIQTRYDFKGSKSEIQWDRKSITILADDDYKLNAIKDILQGKVHHRGIDIRALKFEDPVKASGNMWRQPVSILSGIDKDNAKKIVKLIKDSKLKVQPAIQDDIVRVSSKSIDSLQECMGIIKKASLEVPVQFINMRS
ncbi:MAG: YajQ family cyclic di-GMP-binding protein [Bdellovibrionales bacterium]|nr:YajQ family cyclic di-GMP-binding protein [Bdellovibrionales bacterium]